MLTDAEKEERRVSKALVKNGFDVTKHNIDYLIYTKGRSPYLRKNILYGILRNNPNPIEAFEKYVAEPKCPTEKKWILAFGKEEGARRWKEYRERQRETNTYEYKKKKYGWSEEDFQKYNLSRSVTLDNCIRRHGVEHGTKVFEEYCEKQKYAGVSKKYFIEKYGYKDGISRYMSMLEGKKITLENMIAKYGQIEGEKKFHLWLERLSERRSSSTSLKAINFFHKLQARLPANVDVYYKGSSENDKEYLVYSEDIVHFYDFVCPSLKKCIEYNGDYWHCNPKKYGADYIHPQLGLSAKKKWKLDEEKLMFLEKHRNIHTKVVWESDVDNSEESVIMECLDWLNS